MLVTVTTIGALRSRIAWFPNETLAGETLTALMPVPPRKAICGLFVPVSLTVSPAVRSPRAEGVNVTEIVQLAPAARVDELDGQLLVSV